MHTWFPGDGDQLVSNGGNHFLSNDASIEKMTSTSFDTYNDLEVFEQFSESTPSTAHLDHGTLIPEGAEKSDLDFHFMPDLSSTIPVATVSDTIAIQSNGPNTSVKSSEAIPGMINNSSSMIETHPEEPSMFFKKSPSSDITVGHSLKRRIGNTPTDALNVNSQSPSQPRKKRIKRESMQEETDFVNTAEFRPQSSIPSRLSWQELARQGILAAYSSRLNPYALHTNEYKLLRAHISKSQVTIYLNIRNRILRLWHRNPMVAVTRQEAAGCAKESRHFALALISYEWLLRNGYINFGCVEVSPPITTPTGRGKFPRQKTVVVIGAGMAGLGCARHLDHLFKHYAGDFAAKREHPPRIVVIEGRKRVGGRIYSHPLGRQGFLPNGLRSTAEMGAQIVVGFDHGNPLNYIIRGQLALPYHIFHDINNPLYDYDGSSVDRELDERVQKTWNNILERSSLFKNKPKTSKTVAGNRDKIITGEDLKDDGGDVLASLAGDDHEITVTANVDLAENIAVGVGKVAGRQYQTVKSDERSAASAASEFGWKLKEGIDTSNDIELNSVAQTIGASLGSALDEGIRQYQSLVELTAQDLRLMNWHHANMEYANASNVNDLNLAEWDQDNGHEFEGKHCHIIGGYSQVPRGLMLSPEPLDVRLGTTVEQIKYNEGALSDKRPSAEIKCANGVSFDADMVVLTTPLGVLKHGNVKFQPPLPDWKSGAIERMGFGLLNKVVLVYEECFWDKEIDILGFLNSPETSGMYQSDYNACRGRFYLFWNCMKTSGRPVLIALMAGTAAHQAEEANDESLVREATERLAKTFAPRVIPQPSEYIITRWKQDPFARGTYSYVSTTTQQGDYELMARPVGPIVFAGEATCGTHPATVHGAYISGLRAASEVIDSLLGAIHVSQSPLIIKKPQAEKLPAHLKRKPGYVDVWEPILTKEQADPWYGNLKVSREVEDYEARIQVAINQAIGPRPVKPGNQKMNPYLMYTKDKWAECKAALEAQKATRTGNDNAKVSKDEIRNQLGLDWRNVADDIKQPYMERCREGKELMSKLMATYHKEAAEWDVKAKDTKTQFMKEHIPPAAYNPARKGRSMNGS